MTGTECCFTLYPYFWDGNKCAGIHSSHSQACGWVQVSCVSSAGAVAVFLLIFAFCKYKKLF